MFRLPEESQVRPHISSGRARFRVHKICSVAVAFAEIGKVRVQACAWMGMGPEVPKILAVCLQGFIRSYFWVVMG